MGLDAGLRPVQLDSLDAPLISWVQKRIGFVLESDDLTAGSAPTHCFGWNGSTDRLVRAAC